MIETAKLRGFTKNGNHHAFRVLVKVGALLAVIMLLGACASPAPEATPMPVATPIPAPTDTPAPLATPTSPAKTETSFIEPIRKQVFLGLADVQDKGIGDEEAYNEIAKQWGITMSDLRAIALEGIEKGWLPTPTRKPPTATLRTPTDTPAPTSTPIPPTAAPTPGLSAEYLHPLDQMAIAFEGNYSRSAIKARIDEAMRLYGLELTRDNYSRAGSVLVSLRKEFGPDEIDILDHMIRSHVEGVNIDFPSMAALSVSALAIGID